MPSGRSAACGVSFAIFARYNLATILEYSPGPTIWHDRVCSAKSDATLSLRRAEEFPVAHGSSWGPKYPLKSKLPPLSGSEMRDACRGTGAPASTLS